MSKNSLYLMNFINRANLLHQYYFAKIMQIESRTCQARLSNYAEMQLIFYKDNGYICYLQTFG